MRFYVVLLLLLLYVQVCKLTLICIFLSLCGYFFFVVTFPFVNSFGLCYCEIGMSQKYQLFLLFCLFFFFFIILIVNQRACVCACISQKRNPVLRELQAKSRIQFSMRLLFALVCNGISVEVTRTNSSKHMHPSKITKQKKTSVKFYIGYSVLFIQAHPFRIDDAPSFA